jgi:hypothetical protein
LADSARLRIHRSLLPRPGFIRSIVYVGPPEAIDWEERMPSPVSRQSEANPLEPDVRAFIVTALRLVETEQLAAARRLLNAMPDYVLSDPTMVRLKALLAMPAVKPVDRRDFDRRQEYEWLRAQGARFRGSWVALDGDRLLASASTLGELRRILREIAPPRAPLLHRID